MYKLHLCPQCHKNQTGGPNDHVCRECLYQNRVQWTLDQDPEDQDWEFSHCEECGSTLNHKGQCTNTSCGNSPFVGEDWI